jgi:hypothetical protein
VSEHGGKKMRTKIDLTEYASIEIEAERIDLDVLQGIRDLLRGVSKAETPKEYIKGDYGPAKKGEKRGPMSEAHKKAVSKGMKKAWGRRGRLKEKSSTMQRKISDSQKEAVSKAQKKRHKQPRSGKGKHLVSRKSVEAAVATLKKQGKNVDKDSVAKLLFNKPVKGLKKRVNNHLEAIKRGGQLPSLKASTWEKNKEWPIKKHTKEQLYKVQKPSKAEDYRSKRMVFIHKEAKRILLLHPGWKYDFALSRAIGMWNQLKHKKKQGPAVSFDKWELDLGWDKEKNKDRIEMVKHIVANMVHTHTPLTFRMEGQMLNLTRGAWNEFLTRLFASLPNICRLEGWDMTKFVIIPIAGSLPELQYR